MSTGEIVRLRNAVTDSDHASGLQNAPVTLVEYGNFECIQIEQARLVDTNVEGVVIKGSGHWLMEEALRQVIPQLVAFINKSQ